MTERWDLPNNNMSTRCWRLQTGGASIGWIEYRVNRGKLLHSCPIILPSNPLGKNLHVVPQTTNSGLPSHEIVYRRTRRRWRYRCILLFDQLSIICIDCAERFAPLFPAFDCRRSSPKYAAAKQVVRTDAEREICSLFSIIKTNKFCKFFTDPNRSLSREDSSSRFDRLQWQTVASRGKRDLNLRVLSSTVVC
jgi:hypothetical protein